MGTADKIADKVAETLAQYSNARKGRVECNDLPTGKRVLVRSVAAIHRSRQLKKFAPEEPPYFVDATEAKELIENNDVLLVKDLHGNPIFEKNKEK